MVLQSHEISLGKISRQFICRSAESIGYRNDKHDCEVAVNQLQRRRVGTVLSEDQDDR